MWMDAIKKDNAEVEEDARDVINSCNCMNETLLTSKMEDSWCQKLEELMDETKGHQVIGPLVQGIQAVVSGEYTLTSKDDGSMKKRPPEVTSGIVMRLIDESALEYRQCDVISHRRNRMKNAQRCRECRIFE